ncbi:MAG: hypothetical protein U1F56_14600 [Rubrivivax sp.]
MSHVYAEIHAYPHPAVPRGAQLVDVVVSALRLLIASMHRRPSRAEEAAAVREMAMSLQSTDPSFAADLMAAAMRHEGLDDEVGRR